MRRRWPHAGQVRRRSFFLRTTCPTGLNSLRYFSSAYGLIAGHNTNTTALLQNIKEGIEGHAASWYGDVFDLVFPNLDVESANQRWKTQLAKVASSDTTKADE